MRFAREFYSTQDWNYYLNSGLTGTALNAQFDVANQIMQVQQSLDALDAAGIDYEFDTELMNQLNDHINQN